MKTLRGAAKMMSASWCAIAAIWGFGEGEERQRTFDFPGYFGLEQFLRRLGGVHAFTQNGPFVVSRSLKVQHLRTEAFQRLKKETFRRTRWPAYHVKVIVRDTLQSLPDRLAVPLVPSVHNENVPAHAAEGVGQAQTAVTASPAVHKNVGVRR